MNSIISAAPGLEKIAGASHAAEVLATAVERFEHAQRAARWHGLWSRITGQPGRPPTLREAMGTRAVSGQHAAGARIVPMKQIRGSETAQADFDAAFRPVSARARGRWLSVARVMAEHDLPPVELLRLGDQYFVRDGHHRISVARAMGQTHIDALVTVVETAPAGSSAVGSASSSRIRFANSSWKISGCATRSAGRCSTADGACCAWISHTYHPWKRGGRPLNP